MIGVQTDVFRFDQQFCRDRNVTIVPCDLTAGNPAGSIRPYQQNFFTNQNQLNGRTITGITAYGNITAGRNLSFLGWGTPITAAAFPGFLLNVIDSNGNIRLSNYPLSAMSDTRAGAITNFPFTKRFQIFNVDWAKSYVVCTRPHLDAVGNSVLFFVQYE